MTTNQTIDGVLVLSAALALVRSNEAPAKDAAIRELRALLDAPAKPSTTTEAVATIIRDICEHEPDDNPDAAHISIKALELILLQNLEGFQQQPATQPQGELVAWIDWSGGDCPVDADAMVEYAMAGNPQQVCRPEVACRLDWRHDHRPTKRKSNIAKYRDVAEQPAPVAVDALSTGFYVTESGGGKYAINIGFRSMADMQAADAQLRELLKSR